MPQALVGAIVGEFMAASRGLGYRLELTRNNFDTSLVMAGILVLAIVVVLGNGLPERRTLAWRGERGQ